MLFRSVRPDKDTSRIAWEASWREDLEKVYLTGGFAVHPNDTLASVETAASVAWFNSDGTLMAMQYQQRFICQLQQDLGRETAARFAEDGLEREWLASTHDRRCTVVLEGIYRAMSIVGMEGRRRLCPESTLHHLTSCGGRAYLDLLKACIPTDLDAPLVEPIQVPHPVMDRLFSLKPDDLKMPGMQTLMRGHKLNRIYCLTSVVRNILLTFVRIPSEPPSPLHSSS